MKSRCKFNRRAAVSAIAASVLTVPALGQDLSLENVAFTFDNATNEGPVYATFAPGDNDHLYVVEQGGRIRVLDLNDNTWESNLFLDVSVNTSGNEMGLLGLAFDPDYQSNGEFYVYASGNSFSGGQNHASYIYRYDRQGAAGSLTANAASQDTIFRVGQPNSNHNGGWIGFSPNDGYLYIALGDGGGGDDNDFGHTAGIGNGQDITNNLWGTVLRIDPSGDSFAGDTNRDYLIPNNNPFVGITGDDEIWAYGLRNTWRPSFDRDTGDFFLADVGQNNREEINFQHVDSTGGENYGWRLREGTIATPTGGVGGPAPIGAVDPIHEYNHVFNNTGGFSLTGGYIYRGPITQARGEYYFADFVTNNLWTLEVDRDSGDMVAGSLTRVNSDLADGTHGVNSVSSIASFAEDAAGNLYIISLSGNIYRITTDRIMGDLNTSGNTDAGDIALFISAVQNTETVFNANNPGNDYDAGDTNDNGSVTIGDIAIMVEYLRGSHVAESDLNVLFETFLPGDLSHDGTVGVDDLDIVLANWAQSVTLGDHAAGDVNSDGIVDGFDTDIILANWDNQLPGFPASVPEPATAALLMLGIGFLGRRRR